MSSPATSHIDELAYWRQYAAQLERENAALRVGSRQRAEDANQFRDLFEQAPLAYHEIGLDGIVRRVNEAECRLLGLRPDQILGRPVWDFVDETERDLSRSVVLEKLAGKRRLTPVYRKYIDALGAPVIVEVHERLIRNCDGAITGIRTALLDVTARVQADQALKTAQTELEQRVAERTQDLLAATQALEQEVRQRTEAEEEARRAGERWRAIVEACPLGIAILDLEGRVLSWNRAAETLSGWSQEAMLGQRPPGVPSGQEADADELLAYCRQGGTLSSVERQRTRRDGTLIDVCYWAAPLHNAAGEVDAILGLFSDNTDRKRLERELNHYVAELQRSNKDLSQFASAVSHDLQAPLRTITSYTELLTRRHAQSPEAQELADFILGAGKRMQQLIRDLLAYARLGIGAPPITTATPLAGIVDWALANLAGAITSSGATVTHGDLPALCVDPAQMGLLFQNLIGNALKYRGEQPPRIEISARRRDGDWEFRVSDNGVGIAPRHQERIFGVFQRLHGEEIEGTGIGLALCKRIVERQGGGIWVESAGEGHGSTFCFTLPDHR